MATHSVIAFEYLNITDGAIGGTINSESSPSVFNFSDIARVFDRYKESIIDNINIQDIDIGVISLFLKKIIDSGISFTDTANQYVYYRPILSDVIELTDESISHIWTPQSAQDTFLLGTRAHGFVNYKEVESDLSTFILSDTSFAIISRLLTREFKNAIFPFLGTSEEIVYTCSVTTSTVLNICVSNVILTPIIVSVMIYKGGVTQAYIIKDVEIPVASSFVINNNGESAILLEKDDEIRLISDTLNSSDVYIALFEQS